MAGGIGYDGARPRRGDDGTGPGLPVLHAGALWLAAGAPLLGTLILLVLRYGG